MYARYSVAIAPYKSAISTKRVAERKELKSQGVDMKNPKAVIKATAELRESKKTEPKPAKPTQEELLTNILEELKKQNSK